MNIIKIVSITLIILISLTTNSQSKGLDSIHDNKWLVSLEKYFFNLGNVKGEFTQIAQIGNITRGTF